MSHHGKRALGLRRVDAAIAVSCAYTMANPGWSTLLLPLQDLEQACNRLGTGSRATTNAQSPRGDMDRRPASQPLVRQQHGVQAVSRPFGAGPFAGAAVGVSVWGLRLGVLFSRLVCPSTELRLARGEGARLEGEECPMAQSWS